VIPAAYLPLVKWGGIALLTVGVWFHGYSKGNDAGEVQVAKLTAKHAETMRAIAEEARAVANMVRLREHQVAQDVAAIATAYEDKRNAIQSTARAAVLADIRSGRIRLRDHTQAVPSTAQAATAPGGSDGQAQGGGIHPGDLAGPVAESIAVAAQADAQLTACQATLQAYANITEAK
jgi:hypothetical protein